MVSSVSSVFGDPTLQVPHIPLLKFELGCEMVQWAEEFPHQPGNQSLITGSHKVTGEKQHCRVAQGPSHTHQGTLAAALLCTHTSK